MEALFCYESQYGAKGEGAKGEGAKGEGSDLFPAEDEIRERLAAIARFYGQQIGVRYGEPFVVKESLRVDDVVEL